MFTKLTCQFVDAAGAGSNDVEVPFQCDRWNRPVFTKLTCQLIGAPNS